MSSEQSNTIDERFGAAFDDIVTLNSFVGQQHAVDILKVSIEATKMHNLPMDHIILNGRRGSGKSTLAGAVADELGKPIRAISFSAIRNASDLIAILTSLSEGEILLVESFDRIRSDCVDLLCDALDNFSTDIVVGKGPSARSIRFDLPRFTMIATMDDTCTLPYKLKECFPLKLTLQDYSEADLIELSFRIASTMNVSLLDDAAAMIASHSSGDFRKMRHLMSRARDFAMVRNNNVIDSKIIEGLIEMI